MMPALLAIWRQPLLQMRGRGTRGLSAMLIGLFGLGWFSLQADTSQRALLFALCTGVPMGMLALMWWIYLLGNVAAQCHPAALQLVPQLRARVTRAVVLAWLAIVASETLLVGVPTGYPVQMALATGLVLIEVGIMGSLWRFAFIGAGLWLMCFASAGLTAWLLALIQTPAALLAGAVLLVLDGWAALGRLSRLRGVMAGSLVMAGAGRIARANAKSARGVERQPLFLRPLGRSCFNWHADTIAVLLLFCVLARLWSAWRGVDAHTAFAGVRDIVAVMMLWTLANAASKESRRFEMAGTEQALLCLTPGAPERAQLNRVLARMFLSGFVRSWVILTVATLAALALIGATQNELARFALAWPLALCLAALPLRDFARAQAAPHWPPLLFTVLMSVLFSVASNGGAAPGQWLTLSATAIVVSAAWVCWRWQAMLAAAPALPAGRCR